MSAVEASAVVNLALTEEQRQHLATSLGMKAEFVPRTLGVVGVAKSAGQMLGLAEGGKVKFSPALVMM